MFKNTFPSKPLSDHFPILLKEMKNGNRLTYLDNAATTLKPLNIVETIQKYYLLENANVHRGLHDLSEEASRRFEEARVKAQSYINAKSVNEIVFTKGATDGINLISKSYGENFLKEGDHIVISQMEHHSNIIPWQMLCKKKGCILDIIPLTPSGDLDLDTFDKLLTKKVKLLSIVHTSNTLGTTNPIKEMIQKAHSFDIPVIVDGAQALSHGPIDVQSLDCDFFVFSAHKMFGPTGVGVLYGKEKYLQQMPPVQGGGDMVLSVSLESSTYRNTPYKFEAGTPHIAGVIGLNATFDFINSLDFEAITAHEKELKTYASEALSSIEGLTIVGNSTSKAPIFSFTLKGIHPHDIGTLANEKGVAIRVGHHCTEPISQYFNISGTARASMAFYNTKEDIDKLIEAIHFIKKTFHI
ncbi:cysteine sulfinate desulfinase [PVC group bacterium (ex Bugula neritina AB1)]|nr:cysteine sulfinate desulfinase [PVC group bacterium (ex Bugula neritina AB1)]